MVVTPTNRTSMAKIALLLVAPLPLIELLTDSVYLRSGHGRSSLTLPANVSRTNVADVDNDFRFHVFLILDNDGSLLKLIVVL